MWAGVAAARYKVNSNAAVIETNDGLVIVDSHSKPSAARSLYKDVQAVTKKPVKKVINTLRASRSSPPNGARSASPIPTR